MSQQVYITGIGDDRPGIVAGLTGVLLRFEANIVESTMTMLGNQFAFLMIVALPANVNVEQFRNAFQPVEKQLQFSVFVQPLAQDIHAPATLRGDGEPYMISIAGQDRTGITAQFSQVLARHNINIMDLNAKTIAGNNGPAYILMVEVRIPSTVNLPALEQELARTGEEMNVEVTYHPLETVAL